MRYSDKALRSAQEFQRPFEETQFELNFWLQKNITDLNVRKWYLEQRKADQVAQGRSA